MAGINYLFGDIVLRKQPASFPVLKRHSGCHSL